jgi:subtilisin-like proprotein convertase family protein
MCASVVAKNPAKRRAGREADPVAAKSTSVTSRKRRPQRTKEVSMIQNRSLAALLLSALTTTACATTDDGGMGGGKPDEEVPDRDQAIQALQDSSGAPVTVEVGENGATRVLAAMPQHSFATSSSDPVAAAQAFLEQHHEVFAITGDDATSFEVTRVDTDAATGLSHITLRRTYNGVQVFQGAITVHLDAANGVYRALGDDFYRITPPVNQRNLSPAQAAAAAGTAMGLGDLGLTMVSADDETTVFDSPATLDQVHVSPRILPISDTETRYAFQTTLSWTDTQNELQMQTVLVDAEDGHVLRNESMVNTFIGRVFTKSPGAAPTGDGRTLVSFDGNPAASPQGWVGAAKKTVGNNAVAATDLDANNTVGTNETQPTADANNSFDFTFNAAQDAAGFRSAAVANAFFLVNDYHDRTYALGFTESAGNFQTNNFGKGGKQNDEVQVDTQDGSGTNNANFGTPPDGQKPRMQMFLFNIVHGNTLRQDGDFDPTVVYHENTHGVSNRLVGGGSTACLGGIQSGGMGEGWGDFMAASFLNDPVIGAYVTGNATVGIRRASMANSKFTYANIKDGTLTEVHDAGEIWAATLFDVRKKLGAAITEPIVIQGMKLTPCNPTMLQARDGIIAADAQLNQGANRCAIFAAFAGRQMGSGASSPNHNSTTAIVLSTAVPADCAGGAGAGTERAFTSTDAPKSIPDANATGVRSNLPIATAGLDIQKVKVSANITHTFRGDLVIQVVAPNGQVATLSNRAGGSADNFVTTDLDITSAFTAGAPATGTWQLFVRDLAAQDVGKINSFSLKITSSK